MNGARFDRLARTFARRTSRRNAIAAAGSLAFVAGRSVSANQLTPSTCGASGDVCTMLMGCCDGLTCVTSAINTNYGVCVAGEGGTVSVGTTLISPFSENVEEEVAAIVASETASSATTTTTDPQAEREQALAERKARRSSRRNERQLRRSTNKNEQQDRREDRRLDRELRRGPRLRLELFLPDNDTDPEILRVTNRDDESVTLSGIETVPPLEGALVNPPKSLQIGESFQFRSGVPSSEIGTVNNRFSWIDKRICSDSEGFVIRAGFSSNSENHEYTILCSESEAGGGNGNSKRRKRKRNRSKNRNR